MCVWRLSTTVLQWLQCNSRIRRVMTNTNTLVHRWPGVTGESLVPIHWNPSIPRSSPKHYREHTRTQQPKSTRRLAGCQAGVAG